ENIFVENLLDFLDDHKTQSSANVKVNMEDIFCYRLIAQLPNVSSFVELSPDTKEIKSHHFLICIHLQSLHPGLPFSQRALASERKHFFFLFKKGVNTAIKNYLKLMLLVTNHRFIWFTLEKSIAFLRFWSYPKTGVPSTALHSIFTGFLILRPITLKNINTAIKNYLKLIFDEDNK
ncbi:hypothetical protein ACJX0J_033274, partial [Zea mays]